MARPASRQQASRLPSPLIDMRTLNQPSNCVHTGAGSLESSLHHLDCTTLDVECYCLGVHMVGS
jgi:hypothetical protein